MSFLFRKAIPFSRTRPFSTSARRFSPGEPQNNSNQLPNNRLDTRDLAPAIGVFITTSLVGLAIAAYLGASLNDGRKVLEFLKREGMMEVEIECSRMDDPKNIISKSRSWMMRSEFYRLSGRSDERDRSSGDAGTLKPAVYVTTVTPLRSIESSQKFAGGNVPWHKPQNV